MPEQKKQLKYSIFLVIILSQLIKNNSILKEDLEKQDSKSQNILEKKDYYIKLLNIPNLSKCLSNLNYSNIDSNKEYKAKKIKIIFALLDWFSDNKEMSKIEKAAIIGLAVKYNISILTSYKKAVNYPTYSL